MKNNPENKHCFAIADNKITVCPSASAGRPVIYLHTFADEGEQACRFLREKGGPDFTLVSIGGLDWNRDMTPWAAEPVMKGEPPFAGGADRYLQLLMREIMPEVEKRIPAFSWRGIAGYSLAGLFALYALYGTALFARAASVSGSLWFPGFREYVFSHEMERKPERLYFSLGDRECKTANLCLRTVEENTEAIEAFYRGKGIETVFRRNPGGHHKNAAARVAAGIGWLLED